ncbi:MAG: PilN domain-containing protein [Proteobacteria bacterium]|nr:PilN domain-containing protein [Pseudomonadota bacterium]
MSQSLPASSACPDLVVLYPGAGYLNVFAYRIGIRLKTLLWRERVQCSPGVDPFAELPPLLARHPMRLETPAALVADPASGGFVIASGQSSSHRDQVWIERQLQLALPYPAQELHWRTWAAEAKVEIFWLPRAWGKIQTEALATLGLRLSEIYPRAALWREEAGKSLAQQSCMLQEADALHVFNGGLVQRSAPLPADTEAAAQALQLERLALGTNAAGVTRKAPTESEEALCQRVLALWLDGSDAIHLPVGRWAGWAAWQPALRLSAACVALVAVAAIGLSYLNASMENNLESLGREQRKLAPIEQKFMEMERSVRSDRKYIAAAKILDGSALPLDALNRISAALPDKYWIQHMQIKGEALDLTGRGGGNDEVIRLLGRMASTSAWS